MGLCDCVPYEVRKRRGFFSHEDYDDEDGNVLPRIRDSSFAVATVPNPHTFCYDVKKLGQKQCPGLMDFSKGTTTLSFIFDGGVIVAVDSRASKGTYIDSQNVKKVIEINDRLLGTMAGGAADCMFWERHLGRLCRMHELKNQERISVAAASKLLSSIFFQYKAYGLCAGVMIAGWDNKGPSLYLVNDQGDRVKGDLFSVGSGATHAYGVTDSALRKNMTVEEAVELGRRAICAATFRDGGSGGLVRGPKCFLLTIILFRDFFRAVYHIHKDGWTNVIAGEDASELHYMYAAQNGLTGME